MQAQKLENNQFRQQDFLPHKFEILDSQIEICDEYQNERAFFIVISKETKSCTRDGTIETDDYLKRK